MKNLEELEQIVKTETKVIEDKAFELFVKDKIKERLTITIRAQKELERIDHIKKEENIEEFKHQFERGFNSNGSSKEDYIRKAKEELML